MDEGATGLTVRERKFGEEEQTKEKEQKVDKRSSKRSKRGGVEKLRSRRVKKKKTVRRR